MQSGSDSATQSNAEAAEEPFAHGIVYDGQDYEPPFLADLAAYLPARFAANIGIAIDKLGVEPRPSIGVVRLAAGPSAPAPALTGTYRALGSLTRQTGPDRVRLAGGG